MQLAREVIAGDPQAAAAAVALHHGGDDGVGITRIRSGRGFRYVGVDHRPLRDRATLSRIRALAIPPAWTSVWIADDPDGHIQATGRDARGRKQYRYHARWREVRDAAKYFHLVEFCRALPRLRETVEDDLGRAGLSKRKVVATVVALMERAQLRVGNDEYVRANRSYGATTLRDRHAKVHGDTIELAYRSKSGIDRHVRLTDRRLARIVRRCRDLPGQRLFQYRDGDVARPITSTDVNDYIREATGGPFTAKDYRTWAATLGAALLFSLIERPETERACKRCVVQVVSAIAERLGHTVAVCRKSYIHPRLVEDFTAGKLAQLTRQIGRRLGSHDLEVTPHALDIAVLRAIEPLVVRYLKPGRARIRA